MRWPWQHRHKKRNIAAIPQTIQGIQLQSSAVGTAIPLVYGQARVASRLIHLKKLTLAAGNSGKLTAGSDDPNNSAIAMAICEGPIAGVLKAFEDKEQTDLVTDNFTQTGADFVPGTTTTLTLRQTPVIGSVFLQFPRSGLTILNVTGSVVTFTAAIPLGTEAVILTYQIAGGLAARGFVTFLGTLSQAAWGFLTTNYPGEAVPYELTAYIANPAWPTPGQQLPNYSWEVQALLQWGSGILDSNPKDIVNDFLTDSNHGVGFPSAQIASLTTFRDYCTAAGIFLSPVFDTQRPASEILQELLALANSAFVWSDGQLKIVAYGDQNLTGNGATFTANVTAAYNLTDDDFIAAEGEDPIHVARRPQSDVYNMVQVEFDSRPLYNSDIAEAKDQNSIELYGLKPAPVIKAPYIKTAAIARLVAQLALQRQVYIRNSYEFTLPFRYVLLEPMDLVTLTDANLGLTQTMVRLTEVSENDDGTLTCAAEDWIQGVSTAPVYGSSSTSGTPTPTAFDKPPKMPEITGSFDTAGQLILNLSGNERTAKHIYVVRTDRLPTLAETRAGTPVNFAGQSNIATGVTVLAGASVFIGDLAYSAGGLESPLALSVLKREGSGKSQRPVALIAHLNTETDDTQWNLQFDAIAGSGGGGTNLTYNATVKVGFAAEVSFSSGNASALPFNLGVNRDLRSDKVVRLLVTDTLTGLFHSARITVPSQRQEVDSGGHVLRGRPFSDGFYGLRANDAAGGTTVSDPFNGQGSLLPATSTDKPFSYAGGGLATGRMWLAFSWPGQTLYRPDGSSASVPASSGYATAPTPTVSQVASGTLGARTLFVRIAYMKNNVIVGISAETSIAISANNVLKITSPASVTGYDKWVPLVGSATNSEFIQTELPFGTDYQEISTGFNSTTTTQYSSSMLNAAVMQALNTNVTYFHYPYFDVALAFIAFPSRGNLAISEVDAANQAGDGHIPLTKQTGMSATTPAAGGSSSGTPTQGGGRFA